MNEVYKKLTEMKERTEILKKLAKLEKFEAIGTIEELQALKEKNKPKKVVRCKGGFKCPVCGYDGLICFASDGDDKHCSECGQAIYF